MHASVASDDSQATHGITVNWNNSHLTQNGYAVIDWEPYPTAWKLQCYFCVGTSWLKFAVSPTWIQGDWNMRHWEVGKLTLCACSAWITKYRFIEVIVWLVILVPRHRIHKLAHSVQGKLDLNIDWLTWKLYKSRQECSQRDSNQLM